MKKDGWYRKGPGRGRNTWAFIFAAAFLAAALLPAAAPSAAQAAPGDGLRFTLTIQPDGAVVAGGQWRIDRRHRNTPGCTGGWQNDDWSPWYDSEAVVNVGDIWPFNPCSEYRVQFKNIAGYTRPNTTGWDDYSERTTAYDLGVFYYTGGPDRVRFQTSILPWQAQTAGAQWRVVRHSGAFCTATEFPWQNSGAVYEVVTYASCTYHIEFKPISGWQEPDPTPPGVYLPSTTVNTFSGTYIQIPTTTSFTLALTPGEARSAGAQWRVIRQGGGACTALTSGWANSGDTVTFNGTSPCNYAVEFKDVTGFIKPVDIAPVNYAPSLTSYDLGSFNYQLNTISFTATLIPQGAIDGGAQWRVSRVAAGPTCTAVTSAWTNSGQTITFTGADGTTTSCPYLIEFKDVANYQKPVPISGNYAPSVTPYNLGNQEYTVTGGSFCDNFNDNSLDPRWQFTDQTTNTPAATRWEQNGTLYIDGEGASIVSGDYYAAAYQSGVGGNFEAVVTLVSNEWTADWGKAGIMVKNNMTQRASSRGYCFMGVADGHGFAFYADANQDGTLEDNQTGGTVSYPCQLKLVREGDTYSGYYSVGAGWVKLGHSVTMNQASASQDLGLFVTSYNTSNAKTARFDDWCVTVPSITVTFAGHIEPAAARTAGAKWKLYDIDAGAYVNDWTDSDVAVTIPKNHHYNIEWGNIDGWNKPATVLNKQIPTDLACTTTCTWTGTYTPIATTTSTTTTTTTTSTTTVPTTTSSTTHAGAYCLDMADKPLDVQLQAAPAMIMFVIDDSGSMDWEMLCETVTGDGKFEGSSYLWTMSDNTSSGTLSDKGKWKSQWSIYNHMYYNPNIDYIPWVGEPNASITTPRSDPVKASPTLDISTTYHTVNIGIIIDNTDAAFSKGGAAAWATSNSSQDYGSNYYYSNGTGDQWAQWDASSVVPAGTYEIYVNWVESSNRATDVAYKINCQDGSFTSDAYDQRSNGGQWVKLVSGTKSTFTFTGSSGNVRLEHNCSSTSNDRACADAIKFVPAGSTGSINIKQSHYYMWSESLQTPFLVNINGGALEYYRFSNPNATRVEDAGIYQVVNPPDDVKPHSQESGSLRTPEAELQNWANWWSFYRRREYTAKAAVTQVVASVEGVLIGFNTLHGTLIMPVKKVKVKEGLTYTDESADLIYHVKNDINSSGNTPLRLTLQEVGDYYQNGGSDGGIGSGAAPYPFWSEAAGGSCQQAFCVLMSDGYWNGSSPNVGNVDALSTDWSGYAPFTDPWSSTLADVAMKYFANDLVPTLANLVPTNFYDKATHQHMVTYTVAFGLYGSLDPSEYDLYASNPADRVFPTWPQPVADTETAIDDMWHASVNGRGRFLSAQDPMQLVDSLKAIMQNIISRIGSGASVAVNGDELQAGTVLFQSSYSADTWSGDLKAYHVDANTGSVIRDTTIWSAATELERTNWDTGRKIATYDGFNGTPFRYDSLTALQKSELHPTDQDLQRKIVNFIRGDRTNEGTLFRQRAKILGDLVHSTPLFYDNNIFVGGNDGMLHCFNSLNGKEIFGYIPNLIFHNLSLLTSQNYVHMYYVDLPPYARQVEGSDLLVGGFGKGNLGYFLMDVTNAAGITSEAELASRIKWEYPRANTPAAEIRGLGFSFSKAYIVKTAAGWTVLFGNGYASEDQTAQLYAVNAMDGTLMKRINTGVGGCNGLSTPVPIDMDGDGIVDYAYAGDLKGNLWKFDLTSGSASGWESAYNSGGPRPLFTVAGPGGATQPITTRPDAMLHCEQGMPGMIVVFGTGKYIGDVDYTDTSVQTIYGVWDYGDDEDDEEFLGTFIRGNNTLSNQPNTVTLLKQEVDASVSVGGGRSALVLSAHQPIWLTEPDPTPGQKPNPSSTEPNNAGWFFDLEHGSERIVADPFIRNDRFTVISLIPQNSPCSGGGSSYLYEMDPCSGGRKLNPKRPTFDLNGDGVVDESDFVVIDDPDNPGTQILVDPSALEKRGGGHKPVVVRDGDRDILYISDPGGNIGQEIESAIRPGFFYWMEIY